MGFFSRALKTNDFSFVLVFLAFRFTPGNKKDELLWYASITSSSSISLIKAKKGFLCSLIFMLQQFILEQLCNVICPSKLEPVYLLNLNKAHTQEEFIRGSMTKNPYSSNEIGQLMRDVKNKICNQLDLLGLLEDDYGMELLVAGSIISLDLSIAQVYEQVWKKSCSQSQNAAVSGSALISSSGVASSGDLPPMTVTYRLQVHYSLLLIQFAKLEIVLIYSSICIFVFDLKSPLLFNLVCNFSYLFLLCNFFFFHL